MENATLDFHRAWSRVKVPLPASSNKLQDRFWDTFCKPRSLIPDQNSSHDLLGVVVWPHVTPMQNAPHNIAETVDISLGIDVITREKLWRLPAERAER